MQGLRPGPRACSAARSPTRRQRLHDAGLGRRQLGEPGPAGRSGACAQLGRGLEQRRGLLVGLGELRGVLRQVLVGADLRRLDRLAVLADDDQRRRRRPARGRGRARRPARAPRPRARPRTTGATSAGRRATTSGALSTTGAGSTTVAVSSANAAGAMPTAPKAVAPVRTSVTATRRSGVIVVIMSVSLTCRDRGDPGDKDDDAGPSAGPPRGNRKRTARIGAGPASGQRARRRLAAARRPARPRPAGRCRRRPPAGRRAPGPRASSSGAVDRASPPSPAPRATATRSRPCGVPNTRR